MSKMYNLFKGKKQSKDNQNDKTFKRTSIEKEMKYIIFMLLLDCGASQEVLLKNYENSLKSCIETHSTQKASCECRQKVDRMYNIPEEDCK